MASATGTERELALKLWVVLSRAHNAVQRHAAAHVHRHGLTLSEFAILEALYHKGPLLLGELQRKVLTSSGGITYLVDRLSNRGLVERLECAEDRRARYAALTEEGTRFIAGIFPEHAEWIQSALAGLGTAEQQEAHELLRRLGRYAAETQPGSAE